MITILQFQPKIPDLEIPDPITELFDSTPGFMPKDEGARLYSLARGVQADTKHPIVELGTYCGKSTLLLAYAAKLSNSVVITVDHHNGSEENYPPFPYFDDRLVNSNTGKLDTLSTFRDTMRMAGLEEQVLAVVGNSKTYCEFFPDQGASMIFIDAGHGSLEAWMDFINWIPKLKAGGLVAIHDVFDDPAKGGRPPYEIATALRHLRGFEELEQVGSLACFKAVPEKARRTVTLSL